MRRSAAPVAKLSLEVVDDESAVIVFPDRVREIGGHIYAAASQVRVLDGVLAQREILRDERGR